jgi:hypothetical protein
VTNITQQARILRSRWMLKITRAANGEVVFKLSGRMGARHMRDVAVPRSVRRLKFRGAKYTTDDIIKLSVHVYSDDYARPVKVQLRSQPFYSWASARPREG